jgi:hypothetical protein
MEKSIRGPLKRAEYGNIAVHTGAELAKKW